MKMLFAVLGVLALTMGGAEGAATKKKAPTPEMPSAKCADAKTVLGSLQQKYGETVVFYGLASPTMALIIISNNDTRTWTAITVSLNGQACLIGDGTDAAVTSPGRHV